MKRLLSLALAAALLGAGGGAAADRPAGTWRMTVDFGGHSWLTVLLRLDATEGFGLEPVPRLGLVWRARPWLRLKANVERSYRVPNFDELYFDEEFVRGNPNLDPEDALDADGGFDLALPELGPLHELWLEVVGFHRRIDESIVFQAVNNSLVLATNTGRATATGVELGAGFAAFHWVTLSGNWTYLDTEQESTGNPLPGRPEHEWLLRIEIGPASRLVKLVGERRDTSAIPTDSAGARTVSSRATYDLSLAIDLLHVARRFAKLPGRSFIASITATNLVDVSVRDAQFFPQPGRSLMGRLEGRW